MSNTNAIPKPPTPSRPARRSSFAPVGEKTPDASAAAARPAPQSGRQAAKAVPEPNGDQKPRAAAVRNLIFGIPDDEKERMVNTIDWTSQHTGIRHQTKFIRAAIAKACAELEREYNKGEPFPPAG